MQRVDLKGRNHNFVMDSEALGINGIISAFKLSPNIGQSPYELDLNHWGAPRAMSNRRPLLILAVLTLLGIAGAFGLREWRVKRAVWREQSALAEAQSLLKRDKPAEALAVADGFSGSYKNPVWFRIQLEAVTRLQLLPRVGLLYEIFPKEVLKEEAASTLLARGFLQAGMPAEFERVRAVWRGHEHLLSTWRLLDADLLLLTGEHRQAEKVLRGGQSTAGLDAPALVRLALMTAERDLEGAGKLLDQAVALQPTNSVARWSRGEILERLGRLRLARVEFASALAAAPDNFYWRDQFAEFYLRNHNHDLALDTWAQPTAKPSPDYIQLKVEFFNRVLRPATPGSLPPPTPGELERLVRLVRAVKPGRFFDGAAFKALPYATEYATQRPEVFWLRLLDALQSGDEPTALDLLTTESPRLQSWDPDLAGALARVLSYRRKQSLIPAGFTAKTLWGETNRPPLYAFLERAARDEQAATDHKAKLSPDFSALLRSPNIFSHLFLAAGWREAAVLLRQSPRVEPGEPDWLAAAYAKALRLNRTPQAALDFLGTGGLAPAATLVRAELLVETGRREDARGQLRGMVKLSSPTGVRAAALLALDAIEQKDYARARQSVMEQPLLAQADLGKELLARIALAENRTAEAETLYRGIQNTSIEAKTWLASKAFAEHRWQDARRIINEGLALMPDSPQLRESLAAVDKAEATAKTKAPL